jgi:microcystin degradation protein MlrC
MVRVAMIYELNDVGTVNHPIMSVELNDDVTKFLRDKMVEVRETTLFVGNTARFQIENIEIEIKTRHIEGFNSDLMRKLSSQ